MIERFDDVWAEEHNPVHKFTVLRDGVDSLSIIFAEVGQPTSPSYGSFIHRKPALSPPKVLSIILKCRSNEQYGVMVHVLGRQVVTEG